MPQFLLAPITCCLASFHAHTYILLYNSFLMSTDEVSTSASALVIIKLYHNYLDSNSLLRKMVIYKTHLSFLLGLQVAGWVVLLLQVNLEELINGETTGGRVSEIPQSLANGPL